MYGLTLGRTTISPTKKPYVYSQVVHLATLVSLNCSIFLQLDGSALHEHNHSADLSSPWQRRFFCQRRGSPADLLERIVAVMFSIKSYQFFSILVLSNNPQTFYMHSDTNSPSKFNGQTNLRWPFCKQGSFDVREAFYKCVHTLHEWSFLFICYKDN